jgi:integrase
MPAEPVNDQDDTLIDRNPVTIKTGKTKISHTYLIAEPDEIMQLADAMPNYLRLAVLLAGWLGLREGKICGLQRCDIDLDGDNPVIHVRHSVKPEMHDGHQVPVLGPPKTSSSVRDISIPTPLIAEMDKHRERSNISAVQQ